ncbi:patatin [Chroococcidiopsis sp. CCALA 051]|uniref:patatin-like phospholipase family protein n=1 Tax=Chroococcidiopsis sp. CCALA 051 TaxID=869949 RepID=UPI000D0DABA5|nr:patatin-like phospholipase family protein [Chroococcidiopsis sp. CCALA 051]PSM49123.1 patatin [Chroococcidiopsis sp. CCALA 051]
MKAANPHFGLVLTGGGAKGAYQAGALMYLAEIGIEPQIVAGTSIGALNGAVLSAHRPFSYAVRHLNQLWDRLGQSEILRPNTNAALHILSYAAQTFVPTLREWVLDFLIHQGMLKDSSTIFDPLPIEQMLRAAVNPTQLRSGIELWVTVFPALKIPGLHYDWLIDFVRAKTGTDACWLCVQDVADDAELYNLLLASAAIPLAFPCRKVNDRFYVDGGLADNVPLRALAARGCQNAIVIHLENGAAWNRYDFPEQTIIEIRPEQPIDKFDTPLLGSVSSLLNFSAERITELKARGYEDAQRCLEPIIQTFLTVGSQRQSHNILLNSTQRLLDDSIL